MDLLQPDEPWRAEAEAIQKIVQSCPPKRRVHKPISSTETGHPTTRRSRGQGEREKKKARTEKQKVRGAFNIGDGPVLGIDWHRTLAGNDGRVSQANRTLLSVLIQRGFRVAIVSFASSRQRQEKVLAGRRDLQHNIGYPLRLILCPRKLSSDPEGKESLTGDVQIGGSPTRTLLGLCRRPRDYLTRYPALPTTSAKEKPDHLLAGRKES